MKKIMIVHDKMVIGGVERVLISLLNGLDYSKHKIDLYLKESGGEFFKDIPESVNVYILNEEIPMFKNGEKNNIYEKVLRRIVGIKNFYYSRFKKSYRQKKYDVSISFQGLSKLLDLFAGVAPAKKKLIWCHGDFLALSEYTSWFKRTFNIDKYKYKFFDKLIGVSKTSSNNFLKLYGEEYNVDYLWNRIDYDRVLKKSKEEPNVVLAGKYNIVFIGRLVDDKAVHLLVEAHLKLVEEKFNIKTYIVGDGPNYKQIEEMIGKNNLQDSLKMLGLKTNPYNILSQADLLVLPSRNEGFPTVLIESLVLGIPFVTTNVCGASDIHNYIAPKGSSILVEKNVDSIKSGIIEAYNGKIKKGYKFNAENFNAEIDKKFIKLIKGD